MSTMIIGATGFIGTALRERLPDAICPTRQEFDLLKHRAFAVLPRTDIVYICAGANGAWACEGKQESFQANVDAPISIAMQCRPAPAHEARFVVWISSMSVEWLSPTAYQRQKLAAESSLRLMHNVGIVRAGRVLRSNIADLVDTLVYVGENRVQGVTRWGNDEVTYARGLPHGGA